MSTDTESFTAFFDEHRRCGRLETDKDAWHQWVTCDGCGSAITVPPEQRALVFPNRAGRIGGYSTFLEHVWSPLLAKAGLRYRKPHSMRHTFATWALEGNPAKGIAPVPIHHVRDWMGHASVEETERYLHAERARYARAVDGLDAYVLP